MSDNNFSRTELQQLGEFGLINRISQAVTLGNASSQKGIGDDAAVIAPDEAMHTLVSTDLLVEGVHFDLGYVPLRHLGYKAVVVNLSDIYAMNGKPNQITVSIAISNRFSLEAVDELYEGILLACKEYNVDLIGGDTTASKSGLLISITAIGEAYPDKISYRNGAKSSDLICVSGDLGGAYLGLQILEREKRIYQENPQIQPDLAGKDYILERQLKPEARKEIIEQLESIGVVPTSMIDISDGLSSEILHICKQSNTGCTLYEDKLPIAEQTYNTARELNLDPTICALHGGEDYELLFTIDQKDFEKVNEHLDIAVIGHINDEGSGYLLVDKSNNQVELKAQGWNSLI